MTYADTTELRRLLAGAHDEQVSEAGRKEPHPRWYTPITNAQAEYRAALLEAAPALLDELEQLRRMIDNAAPSPSPDLAALREAFSDLLWWAEFTSQEDWHSLDLADTDEESDRRWELHQTFSDRAKLAAWLRAALKPSGWTWGGWLPLGLP